MASSTMIGSVLAVACAAGWWLNDRVPFFVTAPTLAVLLFWLPISPTGAMPWQAIPFWLDSFLEERQLAPETDRTMLSPSETETAMRSRPVIVDCRAPSDYAAGHLEGAINVPFLQVAHTAPTFAGRRVIVTCYYGLFSPVAASKIKRAGAISVAELKGGMSAWEKSGRAVVTTPAPPLKPASAPQRAPPIFMDSHSTTPIDGAVLDAMMPFLTSSFGNAASAHRYGNAADEAVQLARQQVAERIGARASEIVFTSGATEANNLAIQGAVEHAYHANGRRAVHVVTCAIEHASVLDACQSLEARGWARVTIVPVSRDGVVDPAAVRQALQNDTALVTIQAANNEIGTIQPIAAIARLAHEAGALFHTDATQALGLVDAAAAGVDLLSISAHKASGPKGVGALFVRSGVQLSAQQHGGGHEGARRSGTLNVAGIVGFGAACALPLEHARVAAMRDRLQVALVATLDGVAVSGVGASRLAGNLHVLIEGVPAAALLLELADVVAVSSGSACSAHKNGTVSHVLAAIGVGEARARCAVRFGLGRHNSDEHVDTVAAAVVAAVNRIRASQT